MFLGGEEYKTVQSSFMSTIGSAMPSSAPRASKRDHLVDTALTLFKRHGFHATGIDRVIAEAGVARMTLYNHFKSKDELILAALRRRDETFRNWFMRRVEDAADDARGRLLAMFDALGEWFATEDFSGCMFINASAEFAEGEDPIHRTCAEHKALMLDYIEALAKDSGAARPRALAASLFLLMEGAIVTAQVMGRRDAALAARRTAEVLLRDANL